ncbi:MAG: hypothetical protein V9H26_20875 [Verrucomicrobiota bacterium]
MSLPRTLGLAFKAGLLGLSLIVCLGSEYLHRAALPWPFLNQAQAEIYATLQAADVQWLVVICISVYFIGFIWLLRSWNREVNLWRDAPMPAGLALYAIGALAYALRYDQASKSHGRAAPVLRASLLFFGFRFWRAVEAKRSEPFNIAGVVLAFTLVLLSISRRVASRIVTEFSISWPGALERAVGQSEYVWDFDGGRELCWQSGKPS